MDSPLGQLRLKLVVLGARGIFRKMCINTSRWTPGLSDNGDGLPMGSKPWMRMLADSSGYTWNQSEGKRLVNSNEHGK